MPEVVTFQTATAISRTQAKEYKEPRESRLSRPESAPGWVITHRGLVHHHIQRSRHHPQGPFHYQRCAQLLASGLNRDILHRPSPIHLASTPLSLTPRAIGILSGSMGIFDGIFQAVYTAALIERWSTKRVYQASVCAFFPLWALSPVAVNIATSVETDFSYPSSL